MKKILCLLLLMVVSASALTPAQKVTLVSEMRAAPVILRKQSTNAWVVYLNTPPLVTPAVLDTVSVPDAFVPFTLYTTVDGTNFVAQSFFQKVPAHNNVVVTTPAVFGSAPVPFPVTGQDVEDILNQLISNKQNL